MRGMCRCANMQMGLLRYYYGVACGPGFPLIHLQALATRPVSAAIPNAYTHPDIVSLVDPLFAAAERGLGIGY
jgi:hypothetical protein